jgi:hypothetical protein
MQAKLVAKLIREITSRSRSKVKVAFSPKREVEQAYNQNIQQLQAGEFAWARSDCTTYYKNDAGWLTFTMPWSSWRFWWLTWRVRWDEWERIEMRQH